MSKKDLVQNLQDNYTQAISAKGKTAILMDDNVTKEDIAKFKFSIVGNNLVITNADKTKGLTISDYTKLTSIKYGYQQDGNKVIYHSVDFIKNNLVDNTANHIKTYKKTSMTGMTDYNDYIDASASGYTPTGKNIKKNTGLTINGKKGSDTIIGTQYNDTISGGAGNNKIIYSSGNYGIDTVKLTKGENLSIVFNGNLSTTPLYCSAAKNKKDFEISTSQADDKNKIVLKNYYSKDTGAVVSIGGHDFSKEALLTKVTATNYFEAGKTVKKSYTGSALADNIDASGLSKATNVKKGTGLTINGGAGYDIIVGSDFNDTIKGGAGDDTITGGKGNDNLYGVSGDNTFIFAQGDGADTFNSGKGSDTLKFYGINIKYINFQTSGRNLVINYGNNDSVTLKNYFDKNGKVISSAEFLLPKRVNLILRRQEIILL